MDLIQLAILVQQWADKHWWLAFWLCFWALCFAFGAVYSALGLANNLLKIVKMVLRSLLVLARGWPPEHLDADGDWKPASGTPGELYAIRNDLRTPEGKTIIERVYREVKA